ncbi:hypothetical protein [Pseudoxanthomonas sp.]|uniref:hypothetical protein n=1 Tax=Pseudoxanthomonas sp. TaxID=1871049 RepID=UPI002631C6FD|nr:hypothetical protein [Pseudoxanthomonas sp.]WDS35041.1 MAG: hypothetical protein O8I58_11725 [Pseudoxanthomonas sp.]
MQSKQVPGHGRFVTRLAGAILVAAMLPLASQSGHAYADAVAASATTQDRDFVRVHPGVPSEREASLVGKYLADNQALLQRGPIDVQAMIHGNLPAGTPGVRGPITVTEAMVRYDNQKYDPDNRVLNDAAYARALGYRDIFAFPTFAAHDDTFMVPYPGEARDKLQVSQLNHSITSYKPVYPGDQLYLVANRRDLSDLTPTEGAYARDIVIRTEGSIYNQRGEKVEDVVFRVMETVSIYRPEKKPAGKLDFMQMWKAPTWTQRPQHLYTDADWQTIRKIWANEEVRGATPRYWEDVKVGDQPAWTLDGPFDAFIIPVAPYGMGVGGNRTLKHEVMNPKTFKKMVRGDDGIYRMANQADNVPAVPDNAMAQAPGGGKDDGAIDTTDIHKKKGKERAPLLNYIGRDSAIHHINNWMGDAGWISNLRWGIMPATLHAQFGMPVPVNPDAQHFLDKVPFLKGRDVDAHGLTGDVAIVRSYVYDKYFRDGQPYVELAWWVETIDGHIWTAGGATVRLPSKRVAQDKGGAAGL